MNVRRFQLSILGCLLLFSAAVAEAEQKPNFIVILADDLSKQMPEKVVALTKLHDAWLSDMMNPVNGEAKRYGMPEPAGGKTKKTKAERKKKNAATD